MEKKWSKGSFLSFFDWNWNGKSQKKLFSHNPNLPHVANQAKENIEIMPMSQIKMDENGESPSSIACSDFSFALSISSDDEECETSNSPGLVARLMGLDSLPPVSSLSLESSVHSMNNYCHVDSINMELKSNNSSWDNIEASTMERFRNETRHRRFAQPMSVTHSEVLSPIKSHGYMKPKNAAHIMGEGSPQPYMRNIMSAVGPLSASLRTLDLQEKSEAAQNESKFNVNGKHTQRRSSLYKSTPTFKVSRDSENIGSPLGKGKSVSLVTTASKTNVHSRDRVSLNGNRRNMKQKEIKSNQKICNGQNSNVVRQNSVANKGKSTSKVDNKKPTQTRSSESLTGARKTINKCAVNSNIESKRSSTRVTDKKKEYSVSKEKSCLQKKRYMSRDDQNDTRGSDNAVNSYESKSIKCNVTIEESIYNDAFSMEESRDVISFTFTSPLRRNMPESQSTTEQAMETRTGLDVDSFHDSDKVYPENFHVINGDALSVVLSHINAPQCTLEVEDCSVGFKSISEDRFNSMICSTSMEHGNSFNLNLLSDKLDTMDDKCCSSSDSMLLSMEQQLQISEPIEDPRCSSNIESSTRSKRMKELEYVKDILSSAELMAEELAMNETEYMIMPTLFDTLENQRTEVESYEEYSKLQRKAIFDCVSECLRSKCRQVFVARCKAWPRWVTFMRKRWLAEEVYKEMLEFRSMEEEVVVDEIVRKDMCTPLSRWLDFDTEAFENGLEIELDIVTFLVDELVSDLWLI